MAVLKTEIGDLLVDNGVITDDELEAARLERQRTGESIINILSRQGLANESQIKNVLELQYGVNFVSLLKSKTPPDPEAVALLPDEMMRLHQLVCIHQQESRVTVAMVDPSDLSATDDLKSKLAGMQLKFVVCLEEELEEFLNGFFPKEKVAVAPAEKKENGQAAVEAKVSQPAQAKPADSSMSLMERIAAAQRKNALGETAETTQSVALAAVEESSQAVLEKAPETTPENAAAEAPSAEPLVEPPVIYAEVPEKTKAESEPEALSASAPPAEPPAVAAAITAPALQTIVEATPSPAPTPVAAEATSVPAPEAVVATSSAAPASKPVTEFAPSPTLQPATPTNTASAPQPAIPPNPSDNRRMMIQQIQASKSPTVMGMTAMVMPESETELAKRAQEEAIVLLANQILSSAIKRHCTNIHISPGDREGSVNYRLDGALYVDRKLPKAILTPIVARYKMMARMNLAERNICQDGHIKVKSSAKEIVCLVSVIPTQYGEHVSIWIV